MVVLVLGYTLSKQAKSVPTDGALLFQFSGKVLGSICCASTTVNRGGNHHFSVRSIYFSGYSKSSRRKTDNSHICAVKLINDDFPYLFTHNEAKQKDLNGIFLQKNLNFKNLKYVPYFREQLPRKLFLIACKLARDPQNTKVVDQ